MKAGSDNDDFQPPCWFRFMWLHLVAVLHHAAHLSLHGVVLHHHAAHRGLLLCPAAAVTTIPKLRFSPGNRRARSVGASACHLQAV